MAVLVVRRVIASRAPRAWRAPRALRRGVAAVGVAALLATACSGGDSTSAASAKTCEQLVDHAAKVARQVVASLQGESSASLTAAGGEDPFASLTKPFEPFQARAKQLGCDVGELRRLACTAYQGIEPNGPLAEEYLARVNQVCR